MPPRNMMMYAGKKEKVNFASFKKILVYSKKYLPFVLIAMILGVGSAVTTIIGPDFIEDLMNTIANGIMFPTGIDMGEILKTVTSLLIIYGVGMLLGYGQTFITTTITHKVSYTFRKDINAKLNKLPLNYYDTTTTGNTLSVVTNDVDTIAQTLSTSSAEIINAIILFFGVIIMMFVKSPILAGVTIGASLAGFIVMAIILKVSQKHFVRKQQHLGEMNGHIEEVYSNYKIVRLFNGQRGELKKFNETNHKLYGDNWKSQILSGAMMHVMNFVGNLCYVLIFVVGCSMVINGKGHMDLGIISGFIIYSRLFSRPLSTFAQSMTSIQQASAAATRVFNLLEQPEMDSEEHKTASLNSVKGDIKFDHVHFGYLPGKTIINDFCATVKPGQKVAIVGPTGAGKTTLVNLLMRFYDLGSGDIIIDGVSTKDMKRESVHDLFDMILQDTWLFNGTIRENLVFNKKDVSDETLDKAIRAVGLEYFIASLEKGYDTIIDEKLSLSEGQKQQITIARAVVRDAPLLILDEATSSVDTRTELVIQKAMDELTKTRTSFIIAHRLSTIKDADIILVLNNGDIVEQGNHESLLALNGFYAELYNSQFVVM